MANLPPRAGGDREEAPSEDGVVARRPAHVDVLTSSVDRCLVVKGYGTVATSGRGQASAPVHGTPHDVRRRITRR
jgi:hypothetical protein